MGVIARRWKSCGSWAPSAQKDLRLQKDLGKILLIIIKKTNHVEHRRIYLLEEENSSEEKYYDFKYK
jgi:hypothetical protein